MYQIIIERIIQTNGDNSYPRSEKIYSQTVDEIDVPAIVAVINNLNNK